MHGNQCLFLKHEISRTGSRRSVAYPSMHVDNARSDIGFSLPLTTRYCVKLIASSAPMDWLRCMLVVARCCGWLYVVCAGGDVGREGSDWLYWDILNISTCEQLSRTGVSHHLMFRLFRGWALIAASLGRVYCCSDTSCKPVSTASRFSRTTKRLGG